jgi:cell division topological specificity factor
MNLRNLFARRETAHAARDRLQILLAHERTGNRGASDLIITLREEILAAISKHVQVDQTKVNVNMKREDDMSIIEIDFEVPDPALPARTRRAVAAY